MSVETNTPVIESPIDNAELPIDPTVAHEIQPIEVDPFDASLSGLRGLLARWRTKVIGDLDTHTETASAIIATKEPAAAYDPLKSFAKVHRMSRPGVEAITPTVEHSDLRARNFLQEPALLRSNLRVDAINGKEELVRRKTGVWGDYLLSRSETEAELASGRYTRAQKGEIRNAGRQVRRAQRSINRANGRLSRTSEAEDIRSKALMTKIKILGGELDEGLDPIHWRAEGAIPEPSRDPSFLERIITHSRRIKDSLNERIEKTKKNGATSTKVAYHGLRAQLLEDRAKRLETRADQLEDQEFIKSLGGSALTRFIELGAPSKAKELRERSARYKERSANVRKQQELAKNGGKEPEPEPIKWFSWRPPIEPEAPKVPEVKTAKYEPLYQPLKEEPLPIWWLNPEPAKPAAKESVKPVVDEAEISWKADPETGNGDEIVVEASEKSYDAWNDMLGYVASISDRGPTTTMSIASIASKLEKKSISKKDAQKIYQRLQDKGIVSSVDVPGVGHRILKSGEEIRKMRG